MAGGEGDERDEMRDVMMMIGTVLSWGLLLSAQAVSPLMKEIVQGLWEVPERPSRSSSEGAWCSPMNGDCHHETLRPFGLELSNKH